MKNGRKIHGFCPKVMWTVNYDTCKKRAEQTGVRKWEQDVVLPLSWLQPITKKTGPTGLINRPNKSKWEQSANKGPKQLQKCPYTTMFFWWQTLLRPWPSADAEAGWAACILAEFRDIQKIESNVLWFGTLLKITLIYIFLCVSFKYPCLEKKKITSHNLYKHRLFIDKCFSQTFLPLTRFTWLLRSADRKRLRTRLRRDW